MSMTMMFVVALLILASILVIAIMVFRHQRALQEKKASYLRCRKEQGFHHRRYTTFQADLDRLRVSYNSRLRDLMLLGSEIEKSKDEIREILDILREESGGVDEEMEQDLSRIILRRKGMIENLWTAMNGKKVLWLDKLKKAREDRKAQNDLIDKKDKEFKLLTELNNELGKLKREYEEISRSSVFSMTREK
jgi:hypothetical protein